MSPKILFLLLLSFFFSSAALLSKTDEQRIKEAQGFYSNGLFRDAALVYEYVFFTSNSDSIREKALGGKMDCLIALDAKAEIEYCFNRLRNFSADPDFQNNLRIKEALYQIKHSELEDADFNLSRVHLDLLTDEMKTTYWMAQFSLKLHVEDAQNALKIYKEHLQNQFDSAQICKLLKSNTYKSKKKAKLLSTFLPGLGQIYAGRPDQALVSLVLISGFSAYTAVSFVTGYYVTGILTGIPLTIKFYLGGRSNAENLVQRRNDKKTSSILANSTLP